MKSLIILASFIAFSYALPQRSQQSASPAQFAQNPNYNNNNQQQYDDFRDERKYQTSTFIPILRFSKEQALDGSYKTSYETGNNIIAEETGFIKLVPRQGTEKEDHHAQVQHGSYSYTAPDGQLINVEYTADEFGFRPKGNHIPTPPPVSPEIQKGLDIIFAGIKEQQKNPNFRPEDDFNGFYRGN